MQATRYFIFFISVPFLLLSSRLLANPQTCVRILLEDSNGLGDFVGPWNNYTLNFDRPSLDYHARDFPMDTHVVSYGAGFVAAYKSESGDNEVRIIELPDPDLAIQAQIRAQISGGTARRRIQPYPETTLVFNSPVKSAVFAPGNILFVLTGKGLQVANHYDLGAKKWYLALSEAFPIGTYAPGFQNLTVIPKNEGPNNLEFYLLVGSLSGTFAFHVDAAFNVKPVGHITTLALGGTTLKTPAVSSLVGREGKYLWIATAVADGNLMLSQLSEDGFDDVAELPFASPGIRVFGLTAGRLADENGQPVYSVLVGYDDRIKLFLVKSGSLHLPPKWNALKLYIHPQGMNAVTNPVLSPRPNHSVMVSDEGYQHVWVEYSSEHGQHIPRGATGQYFHAVLETPELIK